MPASASLAAWLPVLWAVAVSTAGAVVLSNVEPVRDVHGRIVRAKDGDIVYHDGRWLMWGMSYGDCLEAPGGKPCANHSVGNCGFRLDHSIVLYDSPNLSSGSWSLKSENVLPTSARPEGIYFAPKVRWNAQTGLWVLWVNYLFEPRKFDFSKSQYLVGTSKVPRGPFDVVSTNASISKLPAGDFDLFVDDDPGATAYIIFTSKLGYDPGEPQPKPTPKDPLPHHHLMSIERLTPDYLRSTHVGSGYIGKRFVEAPAMFKRKGIYYALFDHCCCFCLAGSGVHVHWARTPLGPWNETVQVGRHLNGTPVTGAQQRGTFWYPSVPPRLVWHGQRWQSAPDRRKDHDFSMWLPLEWDDEARPVPLPRFMRQLSEFSLPALNKAPEPPAAYQQKQQQQQQPRAAARQPPGAPPPAKPGGSGGGKARSSSADQAPQQASRQADPSPPSSGRGSIPASQQASQQADPSPPPSPASGFGFESLLALVGALMGVGWILPGFSGEVRRCLPGARGAAPAAGSQSAQVYGSSTWDPDALEESEMAPLAGGGGAGARSAAGRGGAGESSPLASYEEEEEDDL